MRIARLLVAAVSATTLAISAAPSSATVGTGIFVVSDPTATTEVVACSAIANNPEAFVGGVRGDGSASCGMAYNVRVQVQLWCTTANPLSSAPPDACGSFAEVNNNYRAAETSYYYGRGRIETLRTHVTATFWFGEPVTLTPGSGSCVQPSPYGIECYEVSAAAMPSA